MAALTASPKDAEQHKTDAEHLSHALHRLSLSLQKGFDLRGRSVRR